MRKKMATLILLAVLASIMTVTAAISWTGVINWNWIPTKEFSVWTLDTGGIELSLNLDYADNLGEISASPEPITFYLQNDGDTEITVYVDGTEEGLCTAVWNEDAPDEGWTISQGTARVLAQLTLTITGDGSYTFTFSLT